METDLQPSPEPVSEPEASYFGLQAYWGITKHMGGAKATEELVELCHIDAGKYVLDVGCGVGKTACYVAKEHGSRVVGVDISEEMIDRAKTRPKRHGVEDKVEFRVADAQSLPFQDALFDAVIGESVNAFIEDKQKAISEYVRVTRPGGYVGFNEATWVETPPRELADYLSRAMPGAKFLTSPEWAGLLEGSGLRDIVVRPHKTNALAQLIGEIRTMDLTDNLRAWHKFLSSFFRSSAARTYARKLWPSRKELGQLLHIFRYFGYGIYVGMK